MDFNVFLKKDMKEKQELVNIILDRYLLCKDEYFKEIYKVFRYSIFVGGKRLRFYFILVMYQMYKEDFEFIIFVVVVIEMLYIYILIYDDLLDIDDDDFCWGKKFCYVMFGDGVVFLVGDFFLVNVFELIIYVGIDDVLKVQFVCEFVIDGGIKGLIVG